VEWDDKGCRGWEESALGNLLCCDDSLVCFTGAEEVADAYRGRYGEGQGEGHVDETSNIQKCPGNGRIGRVSGTNCKNVIPAPLIDGGKM